MNLVFFGNCADYSPAFVTELARRSRDGSDPVRLRAIVCPVRFTSRAAAWSFTLRRKLDVVFDLASKRPLLGPLRNPLRHTSRGFYRRMHEVACQAQVPLLTPTKLSEPQLLNELRALEPDLALIAGLDRIVREPLLSSLAPIYNLHPSLLPHHRGPVPEFWQLAAGATEGGVTIHRIDRGIDTGPIVGQRAFPLDPWSDAEDFIARAIRTGLELMNELLDSHPVLPERPPTTSEGSYQPAPTNEDRVVHFRKPATAVFDRARAVGFRSPLHLHVPRTAWERGEPLTCAAVAGPDTLLLEAWDPVPFPESRDLAPGCLVRPQSGGGVVICNPGAVYFRELRPRTSE